MEKKCLIAYASRSGNTAKVAERFKSTFEKHGWKCDMMHIDQKFDYMHPQYKFKDYDFVCVGSGVYNHIAPEEIVNTIKAQASDLKMDPKKMPKAPPKTPPKGTIGHHKIFVDDSKRALVFTTYWGHEFGPKETEPTQKLVELEIMHVGFKVIGFFCCPGKYGQPSPLAYYQDLTHRPNETDLLKAEMFIEEKLEEISERPPVG